MTERWTVDGWKPVPEAPRPAAGGSVAERSQRHASWCALVAAQIAAGPQVVTPFLPEYYGKADEIMRAADERFAEVDRG